MSMGCFIAMATLPAVELCVEAAESEVAVEAVDTNRSAGRSVAHVVTTSRPAFFETATMLKDIASQDARCRTGSLPARLGSIK